MKRPKRATEAEQVLRADRLDVGRKVLVRKDDRTTFETEVTTQPWRLGHGDWVVGLKGFSGGYDVMRVEPI